MKDYSIKNTTKQERIELIKSWIPADETIDDNDVDMWEMYRDYIDGKLEISECNSKFQAQYMFCEEITDKKKELVFFDIDGTLAVPRYLVDGQYVTGFTDEGWFEFNKRERENGYNSCIVVKPVERYARKRKEEGAVVFVLSTSQTEEETMAKVKFVNDNFPGLFEEVITVAHDPEKLYVIRQMAEKYGIELTRTELVEDTYSTLLKANEVGIVSTHISSLVCDL